MSIDDVKPGEKQEREAVCVKCGTCTSVCPVYQVTGRESLTARGKHHLLANLATAERSEVFADIFSKCLLCGACQDVCTQDLGTVSKIVAARGEMSRLSGQSFLKYISRKALEHPGLLPGLALTGKTLNRLLATRLPEQSGLRLRLAAFDLDIWQSSAPAYIQEKDDRDSNASCAYFVGCVAKHLLPEIGRATDKLVRTIHGTAPDVPQEQGCCGLAALASGRIDEAMDLARKNIAAFEGSALPVLASCASCYAHLMTYPELFSGDPEWQERAVSFSGRLQEFSTFAVAALEARPPIIPAARTGMQRVLYHDPCHLRFRHRITAEPRRLLALIPDLDLVELPAGPQCCGQGGLFNISHPDLSQRISDQLIADFSASGAELVVTSCSGCLLQWQQILSRHGLPARVKHLAALLGEYF